MDTPTLFENETLLFPKNVQTTPQKKVTIFKGHLSVLLWPQKEDIPSELSWTTEVGKRVNRIQGLKVIYKVPPTIHTSNPCWLQFTLVSTNHQVDRSLCSEDSTHQIIFPANKLFHGINFQNDEILKHITWKVSVKNQANLNLQHHPIDVGVSLMGYDIQTFRSNALIHPFMEWKGTAIFPKYMAWVSKKDIFSQNLMTSLGTLSIGEKPEKKSFYSFLDHPYFQINSINLIRNEPISRDEWKSLTSNKPEKLAPTETGMNPFYTKLIFLLILAGGLWWGWRQKIKLARLKWLIQISEELAPKQILVWLSIAVGSYFLGVISYLIKWNVVSDILLSLAGIAILLAWRSFVWMIRPDLEFHRPELAAKVYRRPGSPYIAGFIITLVTTTFFMIVTLESVAKPIALIGYYMLVVGVFLEIKHLRNQNNKSKSEDFIGESGKEVTGA